MKLVNASGTVVAEYEYDDWGKLLVEESSLPDIGRLNPIRYRSYYYDTHSKLYYLNSRYYDPETGRFISADDLSYIGVSQSLSGYNVFAYADNDPIGMKDSEGNFAISATLASGLASAGIGATIGAFWGAVSAVSTGGSIIEGIVSGAVSGAICNLPFGNSIWAFAARGFLGGFIGEWSKGFVGGNPTWGSAFISGAKTAGYNTLAGALSIGAGKQLGVEPKGIPNIPNALFTNIAGSAGTVLDITIHYATERKPYTYDYEDIYSQVKEVPEFGVIICGNNRCL